MSAISSTLTNINELAAVPFTGSSVADNSLIIMNFTLTILVTLSPITSVNAVKSTSTVADAVTDWIMKHKYQHH